MLRENIEMRAICERLGFTLRNQKDGTLLAERAP
jgi:hypothetical protein